MEHLYGAGPETPDAVDTDYLQPPGSTGPALHALKGVPSVRHPIAADADAL